MATSHQWGFPWLNFCTNAFLRNYQVAENKCTLSFHNKNKLGGAMWSFKHREALQRHLDKLKIHKKFKKNKY